MFSVFSPLRVYRQAVLKILSAIFPYDSGSYKNLTGIPTVEKHKIAIHSVVQETVARLSKATFFYPLSSEKFLPSASRCECKAI